MGSRNSLSGCMPMYWPMYSMQLSGGMALCRNGGAGYGGISRGMEVYRVLLFKTGNH